MARNAKITVVQKARKEKNHARWNDWVSSDLDRCVRFHLATKAQAITKRSHSVETRPTP